MARSSRRQEVAGLLHSNPGRWFASAEIAEIRGVQGEEPQTLGSEWIFKLLNRMFVSGDIEKRFVTEAEKAERGLAPMTIWVFGVPVPVAVADET